MTMQNLLAFIDDDVATDETLSSFVPTDVLARVKTMRTVVDDAVANKAYTPEELAALLTDLQNATTTAQSSSAESSSAQSSSAESSSAQSSSAASEASSGTNESLTTGAIRLIYLYHAALTNSDPTWTLSMNELFNYLNDVISNDSTFEPYLNDAMRTKIRDTAQQITQSYNQLVGSDYSRLAVKTTFASGSNEAIDFIANLDKQCSDAGLTEYHLVGQAAMAYEMSKGFSAEQNLIMLITVISIFIIVALTFKSLIIPLILVVLIQCGVFATVVIIGLQGSSIYFIALLIVQCILMGATIDYAILYTTYYREKRATLSIREALGAAYNGSIETILTSGSVLVIVTWLLSFTFQDPAVGQICLTISKGACCALVLIVFVLPSLLAVFDRFAYRKKSEKVEVSPTDISEESEKPQADTGEEN